MIWLMPGDAVVLLTIATNLKRNDAGLPAALPLIAATLLIAALPLLFYVLLRHRAQRLMPEVRAWMNTHIWLLNIITCVVFIALIL
jgi:hypothetical protein